MLRPQAGFSFLKSEAMLTTKKVIEDAIKVREDEKRQIQEQMLTPVNKEALFCHADNVNNLRSQIAELKQSLQIIYDANNNK